MTALASALDDEQTCNGFVVVTRFKRASNPERALAYEHYAKLADAVAHYRNPGHDFEPYAVMPAKDGLPCGPALDMQAILQVQPGAKHYYGLREWEPNSPENMHLREKRREIGEPAL